MVPGDASSLWAEAVDRSRSNGECFPVCKVFRCLYVCLLVGAVLSFFFGSSPRTPPPRSACLRSFPVTDLVR